jgi:hypothetical protein
MVSFGSQYRVIDCEMGPVEVTRELIDYLVLNGVIIMELPPEHEGVDVEILEYALSKGLKIYRRR